MTQRIQGIHAYLQQVFCNTLLLKKCVHGIEKTTFSFLIPPFPKETFLLSGLRTQKKRYLVEL